MDNSKMYDLIRRPIITEKSNLNAEHKKYVFEVSKSADKFSVKNSIEYIFDTKVLFINILNVKGYVKRFRGNKGFCKGYKKAIVTLEKNEKDIDFSFDVR